MKPSRNKMKDDDDDDTFSLRNGKWKSILLGKKITDICFVLVRKKYEFQRQKKLLIDINHINYICLCVLLHGHDEHGDRLPVFIILISLVQACQKSVQMHPFPRKLRSHTSNA